MNTWASSRIRAWKSRGFSPGQAYAHWRELHALASPILFSRKQVKRNPSLHAVMAAHHYLSSTVSSISSPSKWIDYCNRHSDMLSQLSLHLEKQWGASPTVLHDYWPVLAMDEGVIEFSRRSSSSFRIDFDEPIGSWEDLEDVLSLRHAMVDLARLAPPGKETRSWQEVLDQTGLRSVRWSWGDSPGAIEQQQVLRHALILAQERIRERVKWSGPVLGLAGSTSLALTSLPGSHGVVQPDPGGPGQTMTLGHWSVLAHEWLHTLDCRLSRHFKFQRPWATHVMLGWEDVDPPSMEMMAWGLQVSLVMGVPSPVQELPQIQDELSRWQQRIVHAIGASLEIQEEIQRQEILVAQGQWTMAGAISGWEQALSSMGYDHRMRRTAWLLAADTNFALMTKRGEASGSWSGYLDLLRRQPDPPPGLAILLRPVEIMARSFEAALSSDGPSPGRLVWVPVSMRPNAGLLWPLSPEAQFHARQWRKTLEALRPLWGLWKI